VVLDYVRERVQLQLQRLGTDYIDFYHLHHVSSPAYEGRTEVQQHAIDAMQQLSREGVIKTVLHNGPALNNSRVFAQQQKYSVFHRDSFNPSAIDVKVGTGQISESPDRVDFLHSYHARYISTIVGKSRSQIILRWSLQRGVAVIPCSTKFIHIEENVPSELLSFSLSAKIMKQMNSFQYLFAPLVRAPTARTTTTAPTQEDPIVGWYVNV
jgi:diketogulonate reductase-like aldo/keto reductase